jgi:pyruvate/2-oxoglutarate dehydrogenase complex dihydrolipoamide dehydrogenase (E3) component
MAYQRWISWQIGRLERVGVEVMLNRTASLATIAEHNPSVVVVATGAVARQPDVRGVDRSNVFSSLSAIESPHLLGPRVAVIAEDDRSAPLAVADHLAGLGHHVTIFYSTVTPSSQVGSYSIGALLGQFDSAGGEIVTCRKLVAIHEASLEFVHSFSGRPEHRGGFDSVVLATGSVSVTQLFEPLKGAGFETHILGDAYAPRRWTFATRQAFELAQIL